MELFITSLQEAKQLLEQQPNFYRVVSISSPLDPVDDLENAKEVLYLYFDDIDKIRKKNTIIQLKTVSQEDCQKALEFLNGDGPLLIHCHHGKSRSTAIALGFLLQKNDNYEQAIEELLRLKPWATPNEYIVELMCSIFNRSNQYSQILSYFYQKRKEYLSKFYKRPHGKFGLVK